MTSSRRVFLQKSIKVAGGLMLTGILPSFQFDSEANAIPFKISLAQWSLHRSLQTRSIRNLDFPEIAHKKFGINAVEYVNQFFMDKARDHAYLRILKRRCEDNNVKSLLIMVDNEGELASAEKSQQKKAIENHLKWIEAASYLDCHSIRVNLHGGNNAQTWKETSVESLGKLSEIGAKQKINILVENHGHFSSNGKLVTDVIKQVNNPFCGTLPDFGNFCLQREKADLWDSPCIENYDRYKGVEEMLPFAKGISAKSFHFDDEGYENSIDYKQMFKLIKKSGFNGYIGIEYEGDKLSEEEGILKTKALLERLRKEF